MSLSFTLAEAPSLSSFAKGVQSNLMSFLFQFQIGESWWASFVRYSIAFQFREESNLLFKR
jgi:hypothetical protein